MKAREAFDELLHAIGSDDLSSAASEALRSLDVAIRTDDLRMKSAEVAACDRELLARFARRVLDAHWCGCSACGDLTDALAVEERTSGRLIEKQEVKR